MQTKAPVLLITHDDFLWQHWNTLDREQWLLTRGHTAADLSGWHEDGHSLAVLDTGLADLPAWQREHWKPLIQGLKLVVASMRPTDDEGVRVIAAGAMGYCHAYAPTATLTHILQAVEAGSVWMGASLVNRLVQQVNTLTPAPDIWHHPALSERESAVALLVARGKSNSTIATETGVAERTVKAHLSSIFEKLGIQDRLQLALRVHGIADTPSPRTQARA